MSLRCGIEKYIGGINGRELFSPNHFMVKGMGDSVNLSRVIMSNNRESYSSPPANGQVAGSVSSEGEQRGLTVPMEEKGPSCTVGQSTGYDILHLNREVQRSSRPPLRTRSPPHGRRHQEQSSCSASETASHYNNSDYRTAAWGLEIENIMDLEVQP